MKRSSHTIVFESNIGSLASNAKAAPGWATRNSGIMAHGQKPETMDKDQDFPVSIEVQLLAGNGKDPRTTSNLCTPGTNVVMNGELKKKHCINSTSKTHHLDEWVTAELEVRGNKVMRAHSGRQSCAGIQRAAA